MTGILLWTKIHSKISVFLLFIKINRKCRDVAMLHLKNKLILKFNNIFMKMQNNKYVEMSIYGILNKKDAINSISTKAFTLVELIVVITILAILSTIWFVSYSWYLAWTRDTSRKASLKAISEWLNLYSTNKSLPSPDEKTTKIMDGSTQIATQWYAWKNVLETISYSTEWTDPKDWTYYSYYLTKMA